MQPTVYFQDECLTIRSMRDTDIAALQAGFEAQGWHKSTETLSKYYQRQQAGIIRVFVAEQAGRLAGYAILNPEAEHGPFAHNGVPYISDFNVFKPYQRLGIGTSIMDEAEKTAFKTHDCVCLGVGLHPGYGTAQRMYARRGYIPDGSGVWYCNQCLAEGGQCFNDDDLILYLEKKRP